MKERKTEHAIKPSQVANGSEISDDDVHDDVDYDKEDGEFSAKYYQLEREIQELLAERFGETNGDNGEY